MSDKTLLLFSFVRRCRSPLLLLVCLPLLGANCEGLIKGLSFLDFNRKLAATWAPIHHQDVDVSGGDALGGDSDFISAIDFDGNWATDDNWENTSRFPLSAHGYYSVVWTRTHWYVVYAFYHPRDWCDVFLCGAVDKHENDLEGLLAIIRRPVVFADDDFGTLEGIVTVFHNDFFSFTPQGSPLTDGDEDIDGTLTMQAFDGGLHPVTAQEAKGHGLKAHPFVKIEGGDGVVYFPSEIAEVPSGPNDRNVAYKLVNIFDPGGMWSRRNDPQTFASFGAFKGDNGKDNAAHAPWAWDDHDDGATLPGGELALDPAKLARRYFDGLGAFSDIYTSNPYMDISCDFPTTC